MITQFHISGTMSIKFRTEHGRFSSRTWKDVVELYQKKLHDLVLVECGHGHIDALRAGPHQGRAEHGGKVLRRHAIVLLVVHYPALQEDQKGKFL